jgi:hypothetical protein
MYAHPQISLILVQQLQATTDYLMVILFTLVQIVSEPVSLVWSSTLLPLLMCYMEYQIHTSLTAQNPKWRHYHRMASENAPRGPS